MKDDAARVLSRKSGTEELLHAIQAEERPEERNKLAWRVVLLNDAAATWLAKRFCPVPGEDDVSEARLAMFDAALYCKPGLGSSYLSVACWYYMRRTTGKRTGVGIHVPANTAQTMSRVKSWMAKEADKTGTAPTLSDAIEHFNLGLDEMDLHTALWAVSNPRGDGAMSFGGPYTADGDESSGLFDYAADEPQGEAEYDLVKLRRALKRLSAVEQDAVMTYSGDCPPLRVVGEAHGISREWVNQTRKRAIRALRGALRVRYDEV
jgi:DNA-directed RNA polymerase specialized sigma subunit